MTWGNLNDLLLCLAVLLLLMFFLQSHVLVANLMLTRLLFLFPILLG